MRPHLIHPRAVKLFRRIPGERDEYGDPATEEISAEAVILRGQVAYAKYDALAPVGGGNDPQGDGHIIFDGGEWDAGGGKVGDEIELSPSESRLVVLEVRPCAHYFGKAWQRKVIFSRKAATVRR